MKKTIKTDAMYEELNALNRLYEERKQAAIRARDHTLANEYDCYMAAIRAVLKRVDALVK